ncbi:MAG: rhomboid family intramembrane serine protease [bacterium]|nr:rhomboid family intramembrane serine protease [bacterium]
MALASGGAILLEADGFRLIASGRSKRSVLHAYDSISHLYVTDRALLIGTIPGLLSVRAAHFTDPKQGPEHARDALRARMASTPGGIERIQALDEVDRLGRREGPTWMIWATVVLCLIGTGFQLKDPSVREIGAFLPDLFGRGEYWRAVTAHFLHALTPAPLLLRSFAPSIMVLPIHLAVNIAGMLVLGHLVERPMGSWRTSIVVAFSAIGTIGGIIFAGHVNVVGASGLVAGLAGAMLALELHYSRWLPSFWRLPRRLFVAVILLQFLLIDQLFSGLLAGGAHLGGFVGGYGSTWLLGRPSLESIEPTAVQKLGSYSAAALVVIGFIGAIPLARHDMGALERHAFRLMNTQSSIYLYEYDNAAAWLIATGGDASNEGLHLAVALADRAVTNTQRLHPGVLDTLAEALFQSGDRFGAVLTIEEAIRLQPQEPYFFEQWRRFTGDRAPDDRPPPPGSGGEWGSPVEEEPEAPAFAPDTSRITI